MPYYSKERAYTCMRVLSLFTVYSEEKGLRSEERIIYGMKIAGEG